MSLDDRREEIHDSALESVPTLAGNPIASPGRPRRRLTLPGWVSALLSTPLALVGCGIMGILILVALCAPLIAPYPPQAMIALPGQPPSPQHIFGTTMQGEDLFSQVVYGSRVALVVGFSASLLTTAIGVVVGMIAGYKSGLLGELLNLVTNIFMVIPYFALLIVIASFLTSKSILTTIVIIAIVGWAGHARMMQSQTLSLRNRDFVQAALVTGEPGWRIIFVEIMPNMISLIAHAFVSGFVGALVADAGLEFIGLGDPNATSWGMTLFWAQSTSALINGHWWHFLFPGLALCLACVSLIFINYAIDIISNPQLKPIKMPRKRNPRPAAAPAPTASPIGGAR